MSIEDEIVQKYPLTEKQWIGILESFQEVPKDCAANQTAVRLLGQLGTWYIDNIFSISQRLSFAFQHIVIQWRRGENSLDVDICSDREFSYFIYSDRDGEITYRESGSLPMRHISLMESLLEDFYHSEEWK